LGKEYRSLFVNNLRIIKTIYIILSLLPLTSKYYPQIPVPKLSQRTFFL
jgi:hypothetical protein